MSPTIKVVKAIYRLQDEMSAGMSHISKGVDRIDTKVGKSRAGMIGWGTAITGVGSIVGEMVDEYNQAMAAVARGTGETGKDLAALQDIATRVGSSMRGGFEGVAEGLANLNTATGLTGRDLETLTTHLAQAAIGMRDDVGGAADSVGQLMNAFGERTTAAGTALVDHLVTASQATGGSMGDLAAQVLRLAPQLTTMGLTAREAATFVGGLNKAGVPAERVLRSLKTVTGEWAKQGLDVRSMLDQSIDRIGRVTSEQEAYRQAVDLFGSSAAPGMVQAIRSGLVPSIDDLADHYENVSGASQRVYDDTSTLADIPSRLRNAFIGLSSPMLQPFIDVVPAIAGVGSAGATMAGVWPGFGATIGAAATKIGGAAKLMWIQMTGPVGMALGAIGAVGLAFYTFRRQIGDVLSSVIGFVADWVSNYIGLWEKAFAWIPGLGPKLTGVAASVRGMVDDTVGSVGRWVDSWGEVEPAAADAADAADDAADALGGGGLAPAITDAADAADDAADALGSGGGLAPAVAGVGTAAATAETEVGTFLDRIRSFEDLSASRIQLDILGNTITRVNSESASASADRFWAAYNAGFIGGAENSISTTIPDIVGGISEIPAWEEAGRDGADEVSAGFAAVWSPDNVAGVFRQAFTGGGGVAGAVAAIGTDLGRQLADSIGGKLEERAAGIGQRLTSGIGGSFGPLGGLLSGALTGGISTAINFGMKALGKLGGWIKNKLFGGPSQGELAARDTFEAFRASAVESLSGTAEFSREVSALMAQGWDRRLAEASAGFTTFAQSAGVGYETARDLYGAFQDAVKAGDEAEMARIMGIVDGWRERGGAIETGAETVVSSNESIARSGAEAGGAVVHSAEEIGRQFQGLTADEAAKLGDALVNLGSKGNRGFTDIHNSALAAGNAVAGLVRQLRAALATEWRGTVRMTGVADGGGGERLTASGGGVFRGPASGYPVLLHGVETVVPGSHPSLVAPPAAPRTPAAAPSRAVQITINTSGTHDGRAVARAVARYLPGELRRAGVTI